MKVEPTVPTAPAIIAGMKAGGAGHEGIRAMATKADAAMKDFMLIRVVSTLQMRSKCIVGERRRVKRKKEQIK